MSHTVCILSGHIFVIVIRCTIGHNVHHSELFLGYLKNAKRNEIHRSETKFTETKRNEINRNEIDRNETKRNNSK